MSGETKRGRKSRTLPSEEEARYANFFQIGHNAFEFLLEFGQQEGKIHTRIYVSPPHARMFCDLLTDTLAQHARVYGRTPSPGGEDPREGPEEE